MAMISFHGVSFSYAMPYHPVFEELTMSIDTDWKTGLVGRNGRGKTTFLNLLLRSLKPQKGTLSVPEGLSPVLFPFPVSAPERDARIIIKENIAPFSRWEKTMEECLSESSEKSLEKYGEIHARYTRHNGYGIDALLLKEAALLNIDEELLSRPYSTLSGGEQTKCQVLSLFLHPAPFPLIDEPTNHLDLNGRQLVAHYLRSRPQGFLLVSHDRSFLDESIDHVLALNRKDNRLYQGNYSVYHEEKRKEDEEELSRNMHLRKEITRLATSSRQKENWSKKKEKEKVGSGDKGAVGAQAARLMKRSLIIRRRALRHREEKEKLLKNLEISYFLKLNVSSSLPCHILTVSDLSVSYGNNLVFSGISFSLRRGERLALTGPNGAGKTSLLKAVLGEIPYSGTIRRPAHVPVSVASQHPVWNQGSLKELVKSADLDETLFRNVLGILGVSGEIFHRPLETFSLGELKKVEMSRSLCREAGLFVWDEPLNYLDIVSREQIEEAVSLFQPTIIFIEHDKAFVEKCATDALLLKL